MKTSFNEANVLTETNALGRAGASPRPHLHKTIDRDQLLAQLHWRYATKQFDPRRKISSRDWSTLEEALVLTPSSYGLQPWKFLVVNDPDVRQKLLSASWGQSQIIDASHLVVFTIKKNLSEKDVDAYLDRIAEIREVPRDSLHALRQTLIGSVIRGWDDARRREWSSRQAYIALGNFLTSAALLGIDACPMEGVDRLKYNELLGLDELGLQTVVVAAAGYRSNMDQYATAKKVRFARDEVIVSV